MNKFYLLLLLIVLDSNTSKSHHEYEYENENDNNNVGDGKPYNEKVYFPGKTNANEVNLKRLNKALSNSFLSGPDSNYIDIEIKERPSAITVIATIPIRRTAETSTNSDSIKNNYNNSPALIRRATNKIPNSSEESNERRSTTTNLNRRNPTRNSSEEKILVNVKPLSKLRVCEIKYAEFIQRIFPQESDTATDANDAEFNGRVLAAPGEYPHMTALGFRSKNNKVDYKCGGSLISENFVITAAHCTNFTGQRPTKVRIGDLNLMIEESYLEPQIRNIKNIYVHPDYRTSSYYNDIALLELDDEVELTEFVRPIRLWSQPTIPFTTAYTMGYGATDFARERTNRLTNLNMTIVSNSDCNSEMPKMPETDRGIIASQICAKDFKLNRDTCQGDSGGPLQLNIRGRRRRNRLHYQLIGITSYGLFCRSGYPSIFTRVYSYLDWIEHIVWKDNFD